jgi:hypothetical protein
MILNNNINSVEDLENNIIEYVKYSLNNMVGGGKTIEGRRILKRTIKQDLSDYLTENKKQIKHKKIKINRERMEQKISEIFDNKFNNNYNNYNLYSQMPFIDLFNLFVPLFPVHTSTSTATAIATATSTSIPTTLPILVLPTTLPVDTDELIKVGNQYADEVWAYIRNKVDINSNIDGFIKTIKLPHKEYRDQMENYAEVVNTRNNDNIIAALKTLEQISKKYNNILDKAIEIKQDPSFIQILTDFIKNTWSSGSSS